MDNQIVFAGVLWLAIAGGAAFGQTAPADGPIANHRMHLDQARFKDWQARWAKNIKAEARDRYCEKEMGEETGWLMAPFLNGFYYGYQATKDPQWVDMLVDWTDAWINRKVVEPDGFPGWPKVGAAGTEVDKLNSYDADSLLGDAMVLRPVVLMAHEIIKTPALKERYGAKAAGYIELAERIFEKWNQRGAWRETEGGGMITVVLPYGIDLKNGQWTAGYEKRNAADIGFSHPNNKANLVAQWMLAMFDATGKPVYKVRAEKWFNLMKSRMKLKPDGTFDIWNYWQPAGPWDFKPDGSTKHWVGVHPNGGYYAIDLESIVAAYEHGLVFDKKDIDRLIATAKIQKREWSALVPYDDDLQRQFENGLKPESWGGIAGVPWYLAIAAATAKVEK